MIGLRSTNLQDTLHLAECLELDEWHKNEILETWLKRNLTTFYDEKGPIFHMCFTQEGKTLRLHAQFDPREKMRTARGIIFALEQIRRVGMGQGLERLVLWTESPGLARFMGRLGFTKDGEDYVLGLQG